MVQVERADTGAAAHRALVEAELLFSIAVAASAEEELSGILATALNYLRHIIPFTGSSIALVEGNELVIRAAAGPYAGTALGQHISRGSGRSWQVIADAQPFLSNDLSADGARPPTPVRSFLAVPLLWRGGAFGLLEVDSTEPGAFLEEDQRLLQRVAASLSGPIQLARRHAEEQRMRAELEDAVRARDVFVGIAAHELKTPLTSMRGYAQLILRSLNQGSTVAPDRLRHAMETIDQQGEKLGRHITQLLDVSRMDAGRFALDRAPCDLAALAREAAAQLQMHAAQSNVDVRVNAPDTPVVADVDSLRIEQVLINLIDNAVKFSPPDGRAVVGVKLDARSGEVHITVKDAGPGVPESQRQAIFQRFHQAHGQGYRGGMGLGLYLSRQIVERHGGRLTAEFPEHGGTEMRVTLPRAAPPSPDPHPPDRPPQDR